MSQEASDSKLSAPNVDRRRLMQGMAAAGFAGFAGCIGDDDDDGPAFDPEGAQERTFIEPPEDADPTGTMIFANERDGIDDFDMATSSLADDSMVFSAVYDGMRVQGSDGTMYNWMAEEYEIEDANDVTMPDDYTEFMDEYEIDSVTETEDGTRIPTFDLDENNLVYPAPTTTGLALHPEDSDALQEGELDEGDDIRILTRTEGAEAAEAGTFGVEVRARLREGITFHNGTELQALDVIGSYDRFVGSPEQGQVFDSFLHAEAPEGMDGYEIVMYSQEADAIADIALPPLFIFPREHHDVEPGGLDPRGGGEVPVGTGPYQVADWDEGNFLELERYEDYWVEDFGVENFDWADEAADLWDLDPEAFPDGPLIETIDIRFLPEEGQRVAALQAGDIDVSYELPPAEYQTFDEDPDFHISGAPSTGFLFMQFPIDEGAGGDLHLQGVRRAVSELIPRQSIVEVVEEGWASPARVPFPRPAAGAGTTAEQYEDLFDEDWAFPAEPDEDSAQAFLDEAGVETPVELVIRTNSDDDTRISKMDLTVGEINGTGLFEAELETPAGIGEWTSTELYQEEATANYAADNATAVIGIAAGFDPHSYVDAIHNPVFWNGCCNFFHGDGTFDADIISQINSARFSVDAAEDPQFRRETYDELWEWFATTVGNTVIDYSQEVTVAGPNIFGYDAYPDRRGNLTYSLWAPYENQLALAGDLADEAREQQE